MKPAPLNSQPTSGRVRISRRPRANSADMLARWPMKGPPGDTMIVRRRTASAGVARPPRAPVVEWIQDHETRVRHGVWKARRSARAGIPWSSNSYLSVSAPWRAGRLHEAATRA